MQLVVRECLNDRPKIEVYDRNRRLLYGNLTKLGFDCLMPQGAFYLFVKSPLETSAAFVDAGRKEHILMVDAAGFACPGYVRLAYCVSTEMIERSYEAFRRLAKACGLEERK